MSAGDAAAVRDTLAAEWAVVRSWIDTIPTDALERPSVLDGWTVRDLVAHLGPGIRVLSNAGVAEPDAQPFTHAEYVGQYWSNADAIAEGTRRVAAEHADDLGGLLDESWTEADSWFVRAIGDGRDVVQARRGPIKLAELGRTRLVEVLVHGDDLARSVPEIDPPAHVRDALREVVKLLLGVLVERAPGRSVEVRVPPFAAVQCIEGTSHTRGTPPNTVEADALTWIRVACGRITWESAVHDGSLQASGNRADEVARHLPLL